MDETAALAELLRRVLDRDVDAATLGIERPGGGGWSNDTVVVTLDDERTRVVVRRSPQQASMFPTYDLRREHDCLQALSAAATVPVPGILGDDLDGEISGRPTFVMTYVDGRVPADDRPSFAEAGWLHDATPAEQRRFHETLVESIAAVNSVKPDASVTAALRRPGATSCSGLVDDLAAIWTFDRGGHFSPIVDDAFDVVARAAPDATSDVLLWGDARPANVIVRRDGFRPAALVDFELAAWGPPELDVTWLAEMDRMRTTGSGVEPLPGFLDDDAAVVHYERCAGRRLDPDLLGWATRFNALKITVLMHRHLRVMVHQRQLPADHRVLRDNISTRRCQQIIG